MPETPPEGGNKLRANNKVRKKLQEEVNGRLENLVLDQVHFGNTLKLLDQLI